MLTYPKSTLGILHMLMHLSSGHVTATGEISHLAWINRNYGAGGLTLGFAPNF